MTIRKCHQPAITYDANRYPSTRIAAVTYLVILSILMNFGIFPAKAQNQQDQIVFVTEGGDRDEIHLSKPGGGQIQKLTLQQKRYATPSLSYDGKRVAFASADGRSRDYDIFVIDIQSREQRQVTFAGSLDIHPSWAPDGSRIVFASDAGGVFNLYTVDENGENRTRLTNSSGDDIHPDWSPDGSKIAFASDQASAVHQVYSLNPRTGRQKQLTQISFGIDYPRWSPDGTKIAFYSAVRDRKRWPVGNRQIWQVSTDGSGLKSLITDGEYNDEPVISHDLKRIAFKSTRDGNTDIYIFDRDSRRIQRLTRHPSYDSRPSWSPDGKHLVFVSRRSDNADIYKINADGGGLVNLTQSKADEYRPAWSPRGDMICFVRNVDGRWELRVMDGNGKRQMRLDNSAFYSSRPTWLPRGDKIAFVSVPDPLGRDYRIYTMDTDGQNKRLLFRTVDGEIRKISWSADGKHMLFVHYAKGVHEIRMLDVITREINSINLNLKVVAPDNAAWAPLGRTIVFSALPIDRLRSSLHYGILLIDADSDKTQEAEPLWNTFSPDPIRLPDRRACFSWSPDGQNILFGHGNSENLYKTGLSGGGVTRFRRNAHSPDWKTPRVWRSVTPKNKLQTTWGGVKK